MVQGVETLHCAPAAEGDSNLPGERRGEGAVLDQRDLALAVVERAERVASAKVLGARAPGLRRDLAAGDLSGLQRVGLQHLHLQGARVRVSGDAQGESWTEA